MFEETVSIVKASGKVDEAVGQAVDLLGGIGSFIQAGDTVVLKPNLVAARTSDTGTTTGLDFVGAVAELVHGQGATPILYDRPGMEFERGKVFRALGVTEWAKRNGIEIAEEVDLVRVDGNGSGFLKKVRLPRLILESKIINLPKLKTHVSATMSCAMKNFVGVLPDEERRWLHIMGVHGPIAELAEALNPALTIVDATTCMEGAGPSYGDAVNLGLVVAGTDMIAVDEVCAKLIGLDPGRVKYLSIALARFGKRHVEVAGERLEEVARPFAIPAEGKMMDLLFRALYLTDSVFYRHISNYPLNRVLYATGHLGTNAVIDSALCDKCGKCIEVCPFPEAIDPIDYRINYKLCVRCLNCLYACDRGAVSVSGMSKPAMK